MSSSPILQIPDKPTHDRTVSDSAQHPTIIYVSNSALPICRAFTPQFEALADKYPAVRFCQLELSSETSAMFKFAPNQLPVVVLLARGPWSRTLMSPRIGELERGVQEVLERAGRG